MGWRRRIESGPAPEQAHRAAFLELFFDLVFVFALARIVERVFDGLVKQPEGGTWPRALLVAGEALLLLVALCGLWQSTYWTTSRYNPDSAVTQTAVAVALAAALIMGVVIPRAFEDYPPVFAIAYVIGRLTRPLALGLTIQTTQHRLLKRRMLVVYSITGTLWLTGAFADDPLLIPFWALALTIEFAAARFGWPVPGLGRHDLERWDVAAEHIAERYQQFFLIALGETILVIGFSYSATSFGAWHTIAFATATATTFLLWRLYYYRAGRIFADAIARSTRPTMIARAATNIHLIMIVGVVTAAVGFEITINHPVEQVPAAWTVPVLLGPALFIVGRARLERAVFGRVSRARHITLAALALAWPLLRSASTITVSAATAAILLAAALADARRARGQPPEAASPPY
jgi:low temperature requirement protein LtrA